MMHVNCTLTTGLDNQNLSGIMGRAGMLSVVQGIRRGVQFPQPWGELALQWGDLPWRPAISSLRAPTYASSMQAPHLQLLRLTVNDDIMKRAQMDLSTQRPIFIHAVLRYQSVTIAASSKIEECGR